MRNAAAFRLVSHICLFLAVMALMPSITPESFLPYFLIVGAALREVEGARAVVLQRNDHHVELVAGNGLGGIQEFVKVHDAFGLVADVGVNSVTLDR